MGTTCPHCHGVVGYSPQLAGQQVSCPHCSCEFTMREGRALSQQERLDLLVHAQARTNQILTITLEQLKHIYRAINSLFTVVVVILIVLGILLCGGLAITIRTGP